MNVAIIGSRGYPSTYGGFETFVRHIAPYLSKQGHSVTVYGREKGPLHRVSIIDEIRSVRTVGIDAKSASTLTYGCASILDAAFRGSDVVLGMNVALGYFLPVMKLASKPTLLNVDGLEWLRAKWGPVGRAVFRGGAWASARFATRLVADSRAIADLWMKEFGVAATFIPYGAEVLAARTPNRILDMGLEPDGYVLIVARFAPENNIELSLDALDLVRGRRPVVVVVGSANYRSSLERRVRSLAETGGIRWLGHVHDQELLLDLWHHAAIYIHGHSVGGTNPALLQALGAGAPTIAYRSVFNREVVRDEGLLYDSSPARLAKLIEKVTASESLRAEMREAAVQRIVSSYRWDDVCATYERNLIELVR